MTAKVKWPKGTNLILVDTKHQRIQPLQVRLGSRAVVTADYYGGDLVSITWASGRGNWQNDGDYIAERFVEDGTMADADYYKAITEDVP